MTEEERDTLFQQMQKLDEDKKTSILARLFGWFEGHEGDIHAEKFFEVLESEIGN